MDVLAILALVAFGVGAILAFIERSWALALVAVGLFLVALSNAGLKFG